MTTPPPNTFFGNILAGALSALQGDKSQLASPHHPQFSAHFFPVALGPTVNGPSAQPNAAAGRLRSLQPICADNSGSQLQSTQPSTQTPQSAAQANPFPQGQSQAAADHVTADANQLFNDPNVTAQNLSSQQRDQMYQEYGNQLKQLMSPAVPMSAVDKVNAAQGIKAKMAALASGVLGQIHIDPQALGAMAMARGTGIGAGAKAYQQQSQADIENDQKQQDWSNRRSLIRHN